jgi:hypothetical protein
MRSALTDDMNTEPMDIPYVDLDAVTGGSDNRPAHELAHVVQQRRAVAPPPRRAALDPLTTTPSSNPGE